MPIDYVALAATAKQVITDNGRAITLYKLSATVNDGTKPWRGQGTAGPTEESPVDTFGVFVVPNTSVPTESRGLGFDWIDQDLLTRTKHVCLVPAGDVPLEDYKIIADGLVDWKIEWGQCLQPGPTRLLYAFGVFV